MDNTTAGSDLQGNEQNPQSSSQDLLTQPRVVQSTGQEEVLQNGRATIKVPKTTPATVQQNPSQASSNYMGWIIFLGLVLLAMIGWWLWRRLRQLGTLTLVETINEEPEAVPKPTIVKATPTTPKPRPKKSKSKRKHRGRH